MILYLVRGYCHKQRPQVRAVVEFWELTFRGLTAKTFEGGLGRIVFVRQFSASQLPRFFPDKFDQVVEVPVESALPRLLITGCGFGYPFRNRAPRRHGLDS